MPARVEVIWASIADSEFCAAVTWAWAPAICRCASACLACRSALAAAARAFRWSTSACALVTSLCAEAICADACAPACCRTVAARLVRSDRKFCDIWACTVNPSADLSLAPLAVTVASNAPKTFPVQPKSNPLSDSMTCAAAVTPSSDACPEIAIFGTLVAFTSMSRLGPWVSSPSAVSAKTSATCTALSDPAAEMPCCGSMSTIDVALNPATFRVPPTRRPWSYLILPMEVFCGTTYSSTSSREIPARVRPTSAGMPAVTDGGQNVPMTSISDKWLNATISTLWVGNSELNETAALPRNAPICRPPVMPIDGTPSKSEPTSSETFVSATPLAPNGSFQVPSMVAKKEMPLGTTRTPPTNSNGLLSMVTSTAPDTEMDTFSGSGTSSNSAFLSTTPSVIVTSPMPAASDRSLSLVPTWALTSNSALPRNLSAPRPDRSSRPSTSSPRLTPVPAIGCNSSKVNAVSSKVEMTISASGRCTPSNPPRAGVSEENL